MIEFEVGTIGHNENASFAFGPKNVCIRMTGMTESDMMSERLVITDVVEHTNEKGFKVEYDLTFDNGKTEKVYVLNTQYNLEVLDVIKEEELWQS